MSELNVESQVPQEELPQPQGNEEIEEVPVNPVFQIKLEAFIHAPNLEFANLALLTFLTTNENPFTFYNLTIGQLGSDE